MSGSAIAGPSQPAAKTADDPPDELPSGVLGDLTDPELLAKQEEKRMLDEFFANSKVRLILIGIVA